MIYDYSNPHWMDQAHKDGNMPDWVYYQLNGRSAEENYEAQRQAFMERLRASEAEKQRKAEQARAEKEAEKQIEKQAYEAVEKAVEDLFKNLNLGDMNINIKL